MLNMAVESEILRFLGTGTVSTKEDNNICLVTGVFRQINYWVLMQFIR